MNNVEDILSELNIEQKKAVKSERNAVLTACPGSGKTRTIVHRLAYLCMKYSNSRMLNIAITYTNRAADEMNRRLESFDLTMDNYWTGTIHQFCMKFIIRPYSLYLERLRFGYRIIDEYVKYEYAKEIAKELNIKINDGKYFENKHIVCEYKKRLEKNREIDFDNILEESNNLISSYPFIAENIAGIIRSIMVDEYQDTNITQYKILYILYSANQKMNLMFVGDPNQAIYSNLGGNVKTVKEISELFHCEFQELFLNGCYRSTQRLIDYYSLYAINKTDVKSLSEYATEK